MTTSRYLGSWLAVSAGLATVTLVPGSANANPADMFGVGGRSMAMGSAGASLGDGPMSAYYNMAGVSKMKSPTTIIGLQMGSYRFGDPSLCVEGGNVGCSEPFYYEHGGAYNTEQVRYGYENPHNLQLGLGLPLHRRVTLGASITMPIDVRYNEDGSFAGMGARLVRMQTLDPYVPSYALYRNRANRFAIYAGLGVEVIDGLHLGLGTSIGAGAFLNLTMGGDVIIETTPNSDDTSAVVDVAMNPQLEMGMSTGSAPVLGVLWEMGNVSEVLDGYAIGLSYRGMTSIDIDTTINTDLTIWADLSEDSAPIAVPVAAEDIGMALAEFVNPRQATFGFSAAPGERFTAALDVTWVQWSAYTVPIAELTMPESDPVLGVAIETSPAREATIEFFDTWVPKLGLEYKLGPYLTSSALRGLEIALRAGGSYEPNPIRPQTGPTNLLNSDRVTTTFGLGFNSGNPLMKTKDRPMSIDLFFQAHKLLKTTHFKDPAAYGNDDPTTVDGYPVDGSYISEGLVLLGGLSATFEF